MFLILIFALGLCIGSFLNAVIYRMQSGDSIFSKHSHCPHCGHDLGVLDLIPLFSFLLLKGRCRYCEEKISWQYPLVEGTTALLFLLTVLRFDPKPLTISYYLATLSLLVIIFVYDLKHFIIPDKILLPTFFLSVFYKGVRILTNSSGGSELLTDLACAAGAGGFFLVFYLFSKGKALGFGDVKLAFFLGFFLGWPLILPALFVSSLLGGVVGGFLLAFTQKGWKSKVPYGPFLIAGALISLFFGEWLIDVFRGFLVIS